MTHLVLFGAHMGHGGRGRARAPVLGAAGEPGGRADEANMTRSL